MKTILRTLMFSAFVFLLSTNTTASHLIITPIVNGDVLDCGGDPKSYTATIQLVRVTVKDQSPSQEKRAVNAYITKIITNNPAAFGITATCGECQIPEQTGCDLSIGGVDVAMTFAGSSGGNSYYKVATQMIKVDVSCTICVGDATGKEVSTVSKARIKLTDSNTQNSLQESGLTFKHYPNPSNGSVTVSFDVPSEDNYTLTVRDIQGKTLMQESLGTLTKGSYKNEFNLETFSTGMYIMSLESTTQKSNSQLLIE